MKTLNDYMNYTYALPNETYDYTSPHEGPYDNEYRPEEKHGFVMLSPDEEAVSMSDQIAATRKDKRYRPRRDAKVCYYTESKMPEIDKLYQELGYVSLVQQAWDRGLMPQETVRKASYKLNRHTHIIIFVLDEFYSGTWKAIYNALVNGKIVMVKYGTKTFRDLQYGSEDFKYLSDIQAERRAQFFRDIQLKQKASIESERLDQLKAVELTENSLATLAVLSRLWGLDVPTSDYEAVLTMNVINTYIMTGIETDEILLSPDYPMEFDILSEEDVTLPSDVNPLLQALLELPRAIKERLAPLLVIRYAEIESFGNEALLDSLV